MTTMTMTLGDARMTIRTVAGTVAGALLDHMLRETPRTFGELRDAVWEVLPQAEKASAADVADSLVTQARVVLRRVDDGGDGRAALCSALGL